MPTYDKKWKQVAKALQSNVLILPKPAHRIICVALQNDCFVRNKEADTDNEGLTNWGRDQMAAI